MNLECGQAYCAKGNPTAVTFFPLSISLSPMYDRNIHGISVKDFSGANAPRILKLGTIVGFDLWYCEQENYPSAAYSLLCSSFYLSLKIFYPRFLISSNNHLHGCHKV